MVYYRNLDLATLVGGGLTLQYERRWTAVLRSLPGDRVGRHRLLLLRGLNKDMKNCGVELFANYGCH